MKSAKKSKEPPECPLVGLELACAVIFNVVLFAMGFAIVYSIFGK